MATATESVKFENISATTAGFQLRGGKYGIAALGTWGGGSATLEALGPDGSTYLTAATAISANGVATVDLPPGQYRFAIATATAVYLSITRIPVGA